MKNQNQQKNKLQKIKKIYNDFLIELNKINKKQFRIIKNSLQKLDQKKQEQIKKFFKS
jgi:hypothetical protein